MTNCVLTTTFETSKLSNGTTVVTASFEELPGVVAEGPSEEEAEQELLGCLQHLKEQLGLEAIGVRTKFIRDWRWSAYSDHKLSMSFGVQSTDFETEYRPAVIA